ncbi:hypothetical protein [Acrocarpospora sp. B8E8]|uniref:hypothetical protein n=1 Tax=Acrocarpospora sp. B8E8 TaxID=3153572 RepID=UPI00325E338F
MITQKIDYGRRFRHVDYSAPNSFAKDFKTPRNLNATLQAVAATGAVIHDRGNAVEFGICQGSGLTDIL